MKTQHLHFRVDPDGITRLIREMWAEGSYDKALNVLGSMAAGVTIPLEKQYDILRGKLKFALFNNDPDQFCIVPDKWKPRNGDYYPDPEPGKLAMFLKQKSERDAEREISRALRGMSPPEDEDEEIPVEKTISKIRSARQFPKMERFAGYGSLEEMNQALLIKQNLPTIETFMADQASRDERKGNKPKADSSLAADMAWVTPDGKFYPCLTKQEHVWLALQFGLTEHAAEQKGWVKITKDLFGEKHVFKGEREPTQRQINTVFSWCEKHKFTLPEWAGGKP